MRSVVRPRVLETEALGQIEIELHCRSLPLAADRVDQLEVQLWAVKHAATFIVGERLPTLIESFCQRVLRLFPPLRAAQCFVGSSCQLDRVGITEGLEHLVAQVQQSFDL